MVASPILNEPSPRSSLPSPAFSVVSPRSASSGSNNDDRKGRIRKVPLVLPPRPRALTPNGFGDDNPKEEKQERPIALFQTSPWFRLPPNIRRDIIRLAFGDKRFEMDLIAVEINEPDEGPWTWLGEICPRDFDPSLGPMTRGGFNKGPWVQTYHETDEEGHIGVRGWLQSCRQNYAETIDILYSTNTFILSREAMATHLHRLLLPRRLAVITSLEIKWQIQTEEHFQTLLDLLSPPHFPSLKRLYISLVYAWHGRHAQSVDSITRKLDQFVESRPELDECAVSAPLEVYEPVARDFLQEESSWKRNTYSETWRSLEGSMHAIRLPYVDSYPNPPFHLGPNPGVGYWLLEGCDAPLTWRRNTNAFADIEPWSDDGQSEED
ncbi:hypothetical protein ACHAPJ_010359 [Fusarium lateritium]